MALGPIASVSTGAFTPLSALADTATTRQAPTGSTSFGDVVVGALDDLSAAHRSVDSLATQAATGQLADVHDYTIAATEASLATELTVAVRNKAVEAFTQIMNMPL